MKKRILAVVIASCMLFALIGLTACNHEYEFAEDDFRLTVSVDRTVVYVGETIVANARFYNLTGRDLRIRTRRTPIRSPYYLLSLFYILESETISDVSVLTRGCVSPPEWTIVYNAIFEKQIYFVIEKLENHIVHAGISFAFRSSRGPVLNMIQKITIFVQGEKVNEN